MLQTQTLVRGTGPVQVNFDGGTLRAKAGTTSFVSGFSGTELNIASGGLTVDTAGFDVTASSPFSGTGTFTKVGAGTLTLSGANSTNFSGVMAINAGTLSVAAATNLGTGGLAFDGGTLQNTGAFTTALPVTLNAGGGTFQTDADLTLSGVLAGSGALTKTGGSMLTLTGANTYSGQTWIQTGTLALSGSGAIASSSRVVADGTFDISAATPANASIQSLAGSGTVNLGAKTLTLTNANDTFAGAITGTGGLTVSAGIETLTGISNYTGVTNVTGTGTLQLLNGGQITGTSSTGLNGPSATATVSGTGSLLQTGSLAVGGVSAGSNATLNVLNGGVVRTTANVTAAIAGPAAQTGTVNVDGGGSLLDLAGGFGVGHQNGITNAFLNITNGGAVHSASGTIGAFAPGSGTKSVLISGTGSSWTVTGALNFQSNASMSVLNGGAVTAATSTIGTSANGTANLLVSGVGSIYSVTGNQVMGAVNGKGFVTLADGAQMTVGGALTLASSAGATGVLNIGGAEGQAATGAGTLNAATLVFGPGTARVNFNHTDANYVFSTAISGGGAVNQTGPGTTVLTGANTYSGPTTVSAGTLRAGGANVLSPNSAFSVLSGGMLDLAGHDHTLTTLSNAGTVALNGVPGTTLTIANNYVGSGGLVQLNAALGGDASPTDRLVVQGNTSGSSTLRVTNVGGAGAPTNEGIKVVDVVGASNGTFALQGNFVLQGQQAVVGGAYAYTLQKNGIASPGDGDWYLRSSLINPPPSAPAGPLYQPGVPLYENYAQVLLGMNDAPSLQQRVGNRYWGGSEAMARAGVNTTQADASWTQSAFWGRIEGGQTSLQPSNTTGSTYNADQMKAQTGLDGLVLDNAYGRLIVGLTAQYGLTTAYVNSFFGNGTIRASGSGVGATATWYGDNGFYVDGQAQTMFYRTDLSSALAGSMTHGNEGFGYAFSLESGKRFGVGNGFWLTPQAQLAYSKVDFAPFADRFGAQVWLGNAESLLGRLGLSVNHQRTWNDASGIVRSDVYAIGNLHYEFLNGTSIDVAGSGFASANNRLWGSIGGGGTYSWANGRYAVFGEVTYRASFDNADQNHGYKGTGGFRLTW
ncbi:autotransporter outer membrane beta-barrel domain-containing protein [Bradyrhizobium sp. NDS-1]|uniref:autotransporter outer membrane beta-barrel domain-containing protein n=1 Tax=Bradyrhizobium sp. NDS-1 TaxID=3080014 RepID=UPI00293E68F5|nr:autotransporter outer membrane beta-barrel domain-containing protein [Bradyrhizobium sp. NDS-1]WOH74030.1 autotransporter outer membrane beta-barrel domain-containing protein [Bradyrhizobium sp. NDS-1]